MKRLLFFLVMVLHTQLNAQDLTGIWRGNFTNNGNVVNGYEVQLDNIGRMIKGVTYSYGGGALKFYLKFSLVGMWNTDSHSILFQEDNLLDHSGTSLSGIENFTCFLNYHKEGKKEILEGDYNSLNYKSGRLGSYAGTVHLEKVTESYFTKEDFILKKEAELAKKETIAKQRITQKLVSPKPVQTPVKHPVVVAAHQKNKQKHSGLPVKKPIVLTVQKKDSLIKDNQPPVISIVQTPIKRIAAPVELPSVLQERTNQLFKTIPVSANEIEISFYDNGEIDGDTISIYLNGKQLAAHKRLTAEPITIKIKIDEDNPEQEVIMVAENLGTIPPNTALMIVKVGGKRYDVNLSSTEQKNAMVKFKYKME